MWADDGRFERGRRDRTTGALILARLSSNDVEESHDAFSSARSSVQCFAELFGDERAGRIKGSFGYLFHAAWEVVIQRSVGDTTLCQQLRTARRRVALRAEKPRHRLHEFRAGVAIARHSLDFTRPNALEL